MTRHRHRPGFTLVEVAVVMALIAILIGLLVPAVSRVGSSARRTESLNNLRQMSIAATQYLAQFDAWPVAVRYAQRDAFTTIAWDWEQSISGEVRPGMLWSFTDDPGRVMQCPEFHGDSTFGADPFTGYNYNTTYIGGEAAFPETGWHAVRSGVHAAACRRTAQTVLFGAGGWRGGANKFMRAPLNSESFALGTLYAGGQAFRYVDDTTVTAFLDGHVEVLERAYRGELATDEVLASSMDFPRNGFLSDDDARYDPR